MKIGLDFDGVIADTSYLKQKYIKKKYGVELAIEECKREFANKKGISTIDYYGMLRKMYETKLTLKAVPVPDAVKNIKKLKNQNHIIYVITSRENKGAGFARKWLKKNKLDIPLLNTNLRPKTEFCRDFEVFVDDDYNKLEHLIGTVPNLFLLDLPYNKHIKTNSHIKRADWPGIYNWVQNQNQYKSQ